MTSSMCHIHINTHMRLLPTTLVAANGEKYCGSNRRGCDRVSRREREILFGSGCFFVIGAIHDEPDRGEPAWQRLALRRLQSGPR